MKVLLFVAALFAASCQSKPAFVETTGSNITLETPSPAEQLWKPDPIDTMDCIELGALAYSIAARRNAGLKEATAFTAATKRGKQLIAGIYDCPMTPKQMQARAVHLCVGGVSSAPLNVSNLTIQGVGDNSTGVNINNGPPGQCTW